MEESGDDISCFGSPDNNSGKCRQCRFRQSCSYYADTAASVISTTHITSYEAVSDWMAAIADYDHIPGDDLDGQQESFTGMLSSFFHYLLSLDDYTVGIICELISPEGKHPGGNCTVSSLGRVHGCSRQAMHRKILDLIAARPELSMLLKSTMYKLSAARKRFIRKRSDGQCAGG